MDIEDIGLLPKGKHDRSAYHNAGLNLDGTKRRIYDQPFTPDPKMIEYIRTFYRHFKSIYNSLSHENLIHSIDCAQRVAARTLGRGTVKRHLLLDYLPFIEIDNANSETDANLIGVLRKELVAKKMRTQSGVMVITVATSGDFPGGSCPANCSFCPDQRDSTTGKAVVPRSYLADEIRTTDANGVTTVAYYGEPSVVRALEVDFDPVSQILYRVYQYFRMGIPIEEIDKLDFRVLGGTFSYYRVSYQDWFLKMIYYTCNIIPDAWNPKTQTFSMQTVRKPFDKIEDEIEANAASTTRCSVIGVSVETRPDHINDYFCKRMRRNGVTKIEMGVQHTDPDVLDYNNRGHYAEHSAKALATLCQFGFKKHIHVMPDLPSSTPQKDLEMWATIINDPRFRPDETKIYPCMVTDYTLIKKWYESGEYTPYTFEELTDLLIKMMAMTPEYMRLPRIIRDIPDDMVIGAEYGNSLRDTLKKKMTAQGLVCRDIREREVKQAVIDPAKFKLYVRQYEASDGIEYFLSYEADCIPSTTLRSVGDTPQCERKLAGLLRLHHRPAGDLKVDTRTDLMHGAPQCEWVIRELHVYGPMQSKQRATSSSTSGSRLAAKQHVGFGSKLLAAAEKIVAANGGTTIAVISGVGVRNYYRNRGYTRINSLGYLFKDNLKVPLFDRLFRSRRHIIRNNTDALVTMLRGEYDIDTMLNIVTLVYGVGLLVLMWLIAFGVVDMA